ncbi:hypothetical protein EV644_103157 [Kribbella orskensis]|uniref:Uncharacterized protein n=1 Tax=Kribbella orskensis TaxID=2512216 RepID=A0ABY2BPC5_9ACTN|nr:MULTISPECIES: hypothetical protein [Kribbella]TCN39758.1 hypothetical protein EV642_106263 [Kribbella sp. VKM Ac-2500]TCO27459.1 hypothetical protein EV644_103157 [Kribbella orskensis]
MTKTWQPASGPVAPSHHRVLPGDLPVLISRLLTRRRVIDQMRTASATCR